MGLNTRLGSRSKRAELEEALDAHNDNRKVIGFASAGSAVISAVFAFKYGTHSFGDELFAFCTLLGGVCTIADAIDYADTARSLAELDRQDLIESPS